MDLMILNPNNYGEGRIVEGWDSVVWVERYNRPGEVTITIPPDPDLQQLLWPGQMITHVDTETIMMIETHKIDEKKNGEPVIEMKGRTIDVIAMENRILTMDDPTIFSFINGFSEEEFVYYMDEAAPWEQAITLIQDFLVASIVSPFQTYPNLSSVNAVYYTGSTVDLIVPRSFPKGERVDAAVYKLLDLVDCGLKLIRPNTTYFDTTLQFYVHNGQQRDVVFSWAEGDVEDASYLWSNRNYRNSAYVFTEKFTRYIGRNLMVNAFGTGLYLSGDPVEGWGLRIASVDATDWDPGPGWSPPMGTNEKNYVSAVLNSRGLDVLGQMKHIRIVDATIAPTSRYEYMHDYQMGDRVRVQGNYGVEGEFRVVEYAITSDKDGDAGFPTLAAYTPTSV